VIYFKYWWITISTPHGTPKRS